MKITNFGILLVLILFPFMIINNLHLSAAKEALNTELRYNAAIDTAVQDGAKALSFNEKQEFEAGYGSQKKYRANKEEAIDAFFKTLYLNFGIQDDPNAQRVLQLYIPAVVVIDYDGYYVYAPNYDDSSSKELKHVWSAKKPYAYTDPSTKKSLAFTLDDQVVAYDPAKPRDQWESGSRGDVSQMVNIPVLNNADTFDQVRRTTIVDAIQNDLEYTINNYNATAKKFGVAYTFTLPKISRDDWNNTIDDIGILAFVQGIPMGDKFYNNYALGGSRIFKKPEIIATHDTNGNRVYYKSNCSFPYTPEETFTSEKEAALHGYSPLTCTNGQ